MSRSDPIRDRYFKAVEIAEHISDWLFYVGAILSIAVLFVEKSEHPMIHEALWIAFVLVVLASFFVGIRLRLYWIPRAADQRNQDFLSSAWKVNLTHVQSDGYYNSDQGNPIRRVAAQVLENSHFTKAITARMIMFDRAKSILYIVGWLVCVLIRHTELDLIVAVAQTVFSEQILSKWFRLEWLHSRSEKTFETVFRLFQSSPGDAEFNAMAVDAFAFYETSKANAAVTLSSKFFAQMNDSLSKEWEEIKTKLKIEHS